MIQINISTKERDSQPTEQTGGYQGGGRVLGEGSLGVWDEQVKTIIYGMNKQGPTG